MRLADEHNKYYAGGSSKKLQFKVKTYAKFSLSEAIDCPAEMLEAWDYDPPNVQFRGQID